jgi:hypothetical protein
VKFGRSSVDTILAGQFGGRRPQLVGYRVLSPPVLSPLLESGTYFIDCERPAFAAHCHSSSRYNRPKNDATSYARQISCSLAESSHYNSDKFAYYGEELMKSCMAYRSWLDAGIVAAAGSDFSPGPFDPRMAIQGMATRKGWDGKTWGANQKITIEEALRVNTINGAYNSHEEAIKGSVTPGKLADFVVLSDDLFTVDIDKIKDLQIARTVVGGNTVHQA